MTIVHKYNKVEMFSIVIILCIDPISGVGYASAEHLQDQHDQELCVGGRPRTFEFNYRRQRRQRRMRQWRHS